jgi:hypothetical protein
MAKNQRGLHVQWLAVKLTEVPEAADGKDGDA